MKAYLLLVAICVASVHAISFEGNISANVIIDNGWDFRATAMDHISLLAADIVSYASIDTSGSTTNNAGSYNISGIAGAGLFVDTQTPYTFLAAFAAESSWGGINYLQNLDVSAAAGYIATAYVRLEEKTPNGTVVATQPLSVSQIGIFSGLAYSSDYIQNDGTISSISYVGRPHGGGNWWINFTFVASSVVGVIDVANAVVGPSSLEEIVQIYNWPYQSSQNHLSLVMLTVSGAASASAEAGATVVSCGSGSAQVYFQASATAQVDGSIAGVNVQATAAASTTGYLSGKEFLLNQIAEAYADVTFHAVAVDFPANAQTIAYDPSVGSGKPLPPNSGSNSAASVVVSASLLAIALLASLL